MSRFSSVEAAWPGFSDEGLSEDPDSLEGVAHFPPEFWAASWRLHLPGWISIMLDNFSCSASLAEFSDKALSGNNSFSSEELCVGLFLNFQILF